MGWPSWSSVPCGVGFEPGFVRKSLCGCTSDYVFRVRFSQFLAIASKPAYLLAVQVVPFSRRICFFVEVIVFAHTASNVHLQLHGAIENSGERILLVSAFECSRGTSSCF